jgi:hypothetical protein
MSRTLTATDRKSLIRLASTMAVGSDERRVILSSLSKQAALRGKADLLKIIAAYDRKDEKVLRALGTKRKIMNFLNKLDQDIFDQVYDETDSDFMTDEFEEWLDENL